MWFLIASYLVPQAKFVKYQNPLCEAAGYVQVSITSNCLVSLEESEMISTSLNGSHAKITMKILNKTNLIVLVDWHICNHR